MGGATIEQFNELTAGKALTMHKCLDIFTPEMSIIARSYVSGLGIRVMVFSATFNNISVISCRSVLLVEDTGENHRLAGSHWQTLLYNIVSSTPRNERDSNSQLLSSKQVQSDVQYGI